MDNNLFFLIYNLNGKFPLLDKFMTFGAVYLIFLIFLLILILSVKGSTKEKKAILLLFIAFPLAILIAKIILLLYYQNRPFVYYHFLPIISQEADASFPSRHTTISASIAFCFAYYKSKWAPLLLLSALFIGLSRIFAGVHYPIDILGGIFVGIIATIIAVQIKKLLQIRFLR